MQLEKIMRRCVPEGDCLIWTGALNTDGYPRARVDGNSNGKLHRVVCGMFHNIEGYVVRHTCDNIRCLNPEHLIPGTIQDNVKDMDSRGRRHRVITPEVIAQVKELLATGIQQKEISKIVGIDHRRVADINRGRYTDQANVIR